MGSGQRRGQRIDSRFKSDRIPLDLLFAFERSITCRTTRRHLSPLSSYSFPFLNSHFTTSNLFWLVQIYRAPGGADFSNEIKDWIQSSVTAIQATENNVDVDLLGDVAIKLPWQWLWDAGRLLSLPIEQEGKGLPTFSQAMAAAWSDGDDSINALCERAGVCQMAKEDMQGILRRRVECWR